MYRTLQTLSWTSFHTHMPSFSQPTSLDYESSECLHWHSPLAPLFWPFSNYSWPLPALSSVSSRGK